MGNPGFYQSASDAGRFGQLQITKKNSALRTHELFLGHGEDLVVLTGFRRSSLAAVGIACHLFARNRHDVREN